MIPTDSNPIQSYLRLGEYSLVLQKKYLESICFHEYCRLCRTVVLCFPSHSQQKIFTVRWIVEIVLCNAVIGSRLEAKYFDLAVRILEPYESWIIVRYDTLIIENLVVR